MADEPVLDLRDSPGLVEREAGRLNDLYVLGLTPSGLQADDLAA
jgi:hypothetical protein